MTENVEHIDFKVAKTETNELVELCPLIRITSSRFLIDEQNRKFKNQTRLATLIQKCVRRFLARKKFKEMNKVKIEQKEKRTTSLIQRVTRGFLVLKNIKRDYLIKKILRDRQEAADKITASIKRFYVRNKVTVIDILHKILVQRHFALILLQNAFRRYILSKKVKEILYKEKNNYSLTYPFRANQVMLKIFINDGNDSKEKTYEFTYCQIKKMFVLYISPLDIPRGEHRALFIVDRIETCDGRYPHIRYIDGNYYNLINFKLPENRVMLETKVEKRSTAFDDAQRVSIVRM
jgi:hypothetical protein